MSFENKKRERSLSPFHLFLRSAKNSKLYSEKLDSLRGSNQEEICLQYWPVEISNNSLQTVTLVCIEFHVNARDAISDTQGNKHKHELRSTRKQFLKEITRTQLSRNTQTPAKPEVNDSTNSIINQEAGQYVTTDTWRPILKKIGTPMDKHWAVYTLNCNWNVNWKV